MLLGAAFVIRFIVLEALYAADGGLAKRLLTTLLEGASLGSIQYEPAGAITGYIAFFVLVLYFVALVLLPAAEPPRALTVRAKQDSPRSSRSSARTRGRVFGMREWTSSDAASGR